MLDLNCDRASRRCSQADWHQQLSRIVQVKQLLQLHRLTLLHRRFHDHQDFENDSQYLL